ncbi:hypothetical protein PGB90_010451 [Kerria lacca]
MNFLTSLGIPLHMDFDGQRRAEYLARFIITLFGIIGFIWGYYKQQFSLTVYTCGFGFTLAVLFTLPPWPMYRRKPLHWQKPKSDTDQKKKK